jgi:hypothetical protein
VWTTRELTKRGIRAECHLPLMHAGFINWGSTGYCHKQGHPAVQFFSELL